jgi:hypothetical protein
MYLYLYIFIYINIYVYDDLYGTEEQGVKDVLEVHEDCAHHSIYRYYFYI